MSLSDVVVGGEVRYVFSQGEHLLTKGGGGGCKKGSNFHIKSKLGNWDWGLFQIFF